MKQDFGTTLVNPLGNDRGATIVIVALAMVVLLSCVALAVDIGMLLSARTEAQRSADGAALSGALSLIETPGDEAAARQAAKDVGMDNANEVSNMSLTIEDGDIDVDLANRIVRVRVYRTEDRGSAIGTWFARIFGEDKADVSAVAAAQVVYGSGANCLKPWTFADGYIDANDNDAYDAGEYDAATTGYLSSTGSAWRNVPGNFPNPPIEPYASEALNYVEDVGRPIQLHLGDPNDAKDNAAAGWYYPWDMPDPDGGPGVGGDWYRTNIEVCNAAPIQLSDPSVPVYYYYKNETGRMIGPTGQGSKNLMDQAPGAFWDTSKNGTVDAGGHPVNGVTSCPNPCPRVIYIPLFPPDYVIESGKQDLYFTRIIAMFMDDYVEGGTDKGTVIGRIMNLDVAAIGGGATTSTELEYPVLIE